MKVFNENKLLQDYLSSKDTSVSIGFIPTMGALHKGHLSLIQKAKVENDCIVVSIFVNPTQFDKKEDLTNYPKTLNQDLKLLKNIDCDVVFTPNATEIYNGNITSTHFDFDGLEFVMEGEHRKGHFDGVGTIVKRLFEIVKPHKAYFGEKDFQQLQIIKKLVNKHKIPVEIVPCEIYRENDGLAMSSRNVRLTNLQRNEASFIFKILTKAREKFEKKSIHEVKSWVEMQFKKNAILKLEYFEIADVKTLKSTELKGDKTTYRAFIAVFAGSVRLIDNISLN